MPDVNIYLSGCDDTTTVTLALTDEETAVLKRVAAATREASEFNCQPRMTVGDDEYTEMLSRG